MTREELIETRYNLKRFERQASTNYKEWEQEELSRAINQVIDAIEIEIAEVEAQ